MSNRTTRLLLSVVLLAGCIGCDQATKHFATRNLRDAAPQSYFGDTLRLHYVQNPGGFLSLGGTLPSNVRFWFFVGFNFLLLAVVTYVLITQPQLQPIRFIALLLLLAGGIGNLIDRVLQDGLVTDFLNVGIGPLRTGIFNVADMAVMLSAVLLIFAFGLPEESEEPAKA